VPLLRDWCLVEDEKRCWSCTKWRGKYLSLTIQSQSHFNSFCEQIENVTLVLKPLHSSCRPFSANPLLTMLLSTTHLLTPERLLAISTFLFFVHATPIPSPNPSPNSAYEAWTYAFSQTYESFPSCMITVNLDTHKSVTKDYHGAYFPNLPSIRALTTNPRHDSHLHFKRLQLPIQPTRFHNTRRLTCYSHTLEWKGRKSPTDCHSWSYKRENKLYIGGHIWAYKWVCAV